MSVEDELSYGLTSHEKLIQTTKEILESAFLAKRNNQKFTINLLQTDRNTVSFVNKENKIHVTDSRVIAYVLGMTWLRHIDKNYYKITESGIQYLFTEKL